MSDLEKYFFELRETEQAMDCIIDGVLRENVDGMNGVDYSESLGMNTYYMFDPFPFLLFSSDRNTLATCIKSYYTQALNDYNQNKSTYRHLKILPSFIKDTLQCSFFSTITRDYVISGRADKIGGIDVLKRFYSLINSSTSVDDVFYSKVTSWNSFKNTINKNPNGNRVFSAVDIMSGNQYQRINSPNIGYAKDVSMRYETLTLPLMEEIVRVAKKFKKLSGSVDKSPKNEFEKYVSYVIAKCAENLEDVAAEVNKIKNKEKGINSKIGGYNKHFDKETYRNQKLTAQDNSIDYWKDTGIGKAVSELNKIANGENDEEWNKVLDDVKHTFNRKELDNDLEKFYNKGHFLNDVLGLEPEGSRYDARKYEDPNRRKIKGVSGYDIYKKDKEIDKLLDEIEDLKKKINKEVDPDKIKKLQDEIKANEEEIELIKQKLDSPELQDKKTDEDYKKKISNAEKKTVTDADISKCVSFIQGHKDEIAQTESLMTSID